MDTAHFKKMLLAKERELLDAIARQNAADAVTLDQVEASGPTIERENWSCFARRCTEGVTPILRLPDTVAGAVRRLVLH